MKMPDKRLEDLRSQPCPCPGHPTRRVAEDYGHSPASHFRFDGNKPCICEGRNYLLRRVEAAEELYQVLLILKGRNHIRGRVRMDAAIDAWQQLAKEADDA